MEKMIDDMAISLQGEQSGGQGILSSCTGRPGPNWA